MEKTQPIDGLPTRFVYRQAHGLSYEQGVTRRDPSPVIEHEGAFHVWYSRTTLDASGYFASVWHATSRDGLTWTEQQEAIPKGPSGAWDAHGVFTPTTLIADDRFYLIYTAVPAPFTNDNGGPNGTPTAIGVAEADSPDGPWRKFAGNPILRPGEGQAFDSHRVDDACVVVRQGGYWLYFKGRQRGLTPGQTKMGLAIAAAPTGPYFKHQSNPVLDSGHEVCVFPHRGGVAAIVAPTGPQRNTLQFAEDGIHFQRLTDIAPPRAPGPFRADAYREGHAPAMTWGLCQDTSRDWPFLARFDCI